MRLQEVERPNYGKKLQRGSTMAIISPSFAAPGKWPAIYQLGLSRLQSVFGLRPVEFPFTRVIGSSPEDRMRDIAAAFVLCDAVMATLGGSDQANYVHRMARDHFAAHPKPFFGFSDNTHLANLLWLSGVRSYYGGSLFTQLAMQGAMDDFTVHYLRLALFESGRHEIDASVSFNEITPDWADPTAVDRRRLYEPSPPRIWSAAVDATGITWGGCLESIDELLTLGRPIPPLAMFEHIVLLFETAEGLPSAEYVAGVFHKLGNAGILERVKAVLGGRAKAWNFNTPLSARKRAAYRAQQAEAVIETVRRYNAAAPIVLNVDFGHTDPQAAFPMGCQCWIQPMQRKLAVEF